MRLSPLDGEETEVVRAAVSAYRAANPWSRATRGFINESTAHYWKAKCTFCRKQIVKVSTKWRTPQIDENQMRNTRRWLREHVVACATGFLLGEPVVPSRP